MTTMRAKELLGYPDAVVKCRYIEEDGYLGIDLDVILNGQHFELRADTEFTATLYVNDYEEETFFNNKGNQFNLAYQAIEYIKQYAQVWA